MNSVTPNHVSNQEAKPGKRLELVFNPQTNGSATPWVGLRYDGGRAGEPVTPRYQEPIDVADELLDLAQRSGLPVVMPAWLRDSMIAQWQQRGVSLYRQDVGREWCANAYIRQGWDAAHLDDCQPALFRGWPAMAAR